jgi:hypothetical protein
METNLRSIEELEALLSNEILNREKITEELKIKNQKLESTEERLESTEERLENTKEELKIEKQKILRVEFTSHLNEFACREELIAYIEKANFASSPEVVEKTVRTTEDFIRNKLSVATSEPGVINMSKFNKKQLAGAADEMNLLALTISLEDLKQFSRRIIVLKGLKFDDFLTEEVKILNLIYDAIFWVANFNSSLWLESMLQKIFVLYESGLLQKVYKGEFEIYNANGITLKASVEVVDNSGEKLKKVLTGKTDVSIVKTSKDLSFGKEMLLQPSSICGELKRSFCSSALAGTQCKINLCTSQVLAEVLAVSAMRGTNTIVRSFLSDLFKFRIALLFKSDEVTRHYVISSLYDGPEAIVCCILFLVSATDDELAVAFQKSAALDVRDLMDEDDEVIDDAENDAHITPEQLLETFQSSRNASDSVGQSKGIGGGGAEKRKRALKDLSMNVIRIGSEDDDTEVLRNYEEESLRQFEANRFRSSCYLSLEAMRNHNSISQNM